MTVTIRHGNLGPPGTDIASQVRAPGGSATPWQLIEGGEKGAPCMSGFRIEDPAASSSIVGCKQVNVEDSGCTEPTIFAGCWENRGIGRAEALRVAAQREWNAHVIDLNVLLGDRIIQSGDRPAETDIARIYWLLGSGYLPIGDAGFIDVASPTNLPAADYTGRYPLDVLAECSNESGQNFCVRWEQETFFLDHSSPWDTAIPDVFTYEISTANGRLLNQDLAVSQCLPNGTKRLFVGGTPISSGIMPASLFWRDSGSAPDGALLSPWLDRYGTRLGDDYVPQSPGEILTLSSPYSDPNQGWELAAKVGANMTPPWAYGWYCPDGWPADGDIMVLSASLTPPAAGPALVYHATGWAGDVAGIAISNVLADLNSTTFPPKSSDELERDPAKVYSGCWFEWNGGHVYETVPTTESSYRHRDVRASDANCKTAAEASALALAYLNRCNAEEDRISVTLENVPSAVVNLARPGQAISLKLSHVPGYEAGITMAIMRRSVSPVVLGRYDLTLDLAVPVLTGFHAARFLAPSLWSNPGLLVTPAIVPADAVTGQTVPPTVVGSGDGVTTIYTLSTGYLSGSPRVWVDGIPVAQSSITETSPTAGTITLDFAPAGVSSSAPAQTVTASWQVL